MSYHQHQPGVLPPYFCGKAKNNQERTGLLLMYFQDNMNDRWPETIKASLILIKTVLSFRCCAVFFKLNMTLVLLFINFQQSSVYLICILFLNFLKPYCLTPRNLTNTATPGLNRLNRTSVAMFLIVKLVRSSSGN